MGVGVGRSANRIQRDLRQSGVESWELLSSQEKATVRRAFEASANDDDLSEAVTKKEVGVDSVRFICPFEI